MAFVNIEFAQNKSFSFIEAQEKKLMRKKAKIIIEREIINSGE